MSTLKESKAELALKLELLGFPLPPVGDWDFDAKKVPNKPGITLFLRYKKGPWKEIGTAKDAKAAKEVHKNTIKTKSDKKISSTYGIEI